MRRSVLGCLFVLALPATAQDATDKIIDRALASNSAWETNR